VTTASTVWCVSSRAVTSYAVTIDGGAQTVTFSLGGGYLVHPTASLDILARLVVAMTTAGVAAPAAYITEDRHVRLTSSGVFTVTWTDTTFRDLLGFTGNLAAASSYTATNRSPLLWSPGKTENPDRNMLGANRVRLDLSVAYGTGGRQTVRIEGSPTEDQTFRWAHIPKERVLATPPTPIAGEYQYFWRYELCGGQRWILLRGVTEGSSTTTSSSYGSATHQGPYKADLSVSEFRSTPFTRSAGFGLVEAYYDCWIPAVQTPEFA
jgi:hypothetical protein